MVKLDRIVTRGGDGGETSLANGDRVRKDHSRIRMLGALDEANSVIGWLRASCRDHNEIDAVLGMVQNDLFDLGAELATPGKRRSSPAIGENYPAFLDTQLARFNAQLKPLASFILPGGTEAACRAHLARTTVRRSERELVALGAETTVAPPTLQYLNRLSDLLFVLARVLNEEGGHDELWVPAPPHRSP